MNLQERKAFVDKLIKLREQYPCSECKGTGALHTDWVEFDGYCDACQATGINLTPEPAAFKPTPAPSATFNVFSELSQYFNKED